VRTRFGSIALRFWKNAVILEKIQSHPIGNRLKTIDFIGGFELPGSKKRLIPSHSKKTSKTPNFRGFLWSSCGMAVEKKMKIFA